MNSGTTARVHATVLQCIIVLIFGSLHSCSGQELLSGSRHGLFSIHAKAPCTRCSIPLAGRCIHAVCTMCSKQPVHTFRREDPGSCRSSWWCGSRQLLAHDQRGAHRQAACQHRMSFPFYLAGCCLSFESVHMNDSLPDVSTLTIRQTLTQMNLLVHVDSTLRLTDHRLLAR